MNPHLCLAVRVFQHLSLQPYHVVNRRRLVEGPPSPLTMEGLKKDGDNKPKGYYALIKSRFTYIPYPEHREEPNNKHARVKDIVLPKQLEELPKPVEFPTENQRWNTNEEIAGLLISFNRHEEWQSREVKIMPPSGTMVLYNRVQVKYRNDGYCWKKRRDGKTMREDHMKLKVQGVECIYGKYSHSAILPTFHRRCYWLLQNPDLVLVHYLNVPYTNESKVPIASLSCTDKTKWTREELVSQLRPMLSTSCDLDKPNAAEQIAEETIESIVSQLLQHQPQDYHDSQRKGGLPLLQAAPSVHMLPQRTGLPNQAVLLSGGNANQILSAANTSQVTATPLILNLSQFQGGNDVIILSGQTGAQISIISNGQSVQGVPIMSKQVPAPAAQGAATHMGEMPDNSVCDINVPQTPVSSAMPVPASNAAANNVQFSTVMTSPCTQHQALGGNATNSCLGQVNQSAFVVDTQCPNNVNFTQHNFTGTVKLENSQSDLLLTQEEIQRTLAANMPAHTSQEISVSQNAPEMADVQQNVSTPTSTDLNFDAFDLLDLNDLGTEFDALHNDLMITESNEREKSHTSASVGCDPNLNQNSSVVEEGNDGLVDVTDFSPEWSYPAGGVKVLITGPWYADTSTYTCKFDGVSVPAQLIQSGVLRCICPAHAPGIVTFHVISDGFTISNDSAFEYRVRNASEPLDGPGDDSQWLVEEDKQFKLALLERMEEIEKRLVKGLAGYQATSNSMTKLTSNSCDIFEARMIDYCEACSQHPWTSQPTCPLQSTYKGMTMLHLAAALGYSRLVKTLIQWLTEKSSIILEYEVDALSLDDCSCTPFMWACALDRVDAAVILYQWNHSAVNVSSREGLLPLSLAREKGHMTLVNHIEQLQRLQGYSNSQNIISFLDSLDCSAMTKPLTSTPNKSQASFKTSSKLSSQANNENLSLLHVETQPLPPFSTSPKPSPKLKPAAKTSKRSERLRKRLSVEILPSLSKSSPQDSPTQPVATVIDLGKKSLRSVNSDPHLSALADSMTSDIKNLISNDPDNHVIFMQTESQQLASKDSEKPVAMDTDDVSDTRSSSPFIDVERVSSDDEDTATGTTPPPKQEPSTSASSSQNQMVTLAKQIIAAMPERIKLSPSRSDDSGIVRDRSNSYGSFSSTSTTPPCMEDSALASQLAEGFHSFDDYRYADLGTPASSLSPESSCLQSPLSFTLDSPPPTMSDFKEYFNAPSTFMEKDFSQLTLSDQEQRHLYEAARIIQDVYRKYKDRQQQQLQRKKEISAAILIQSYYRRYKQYAYYKKMCQAAVLIQSQFRSYQVQKKFKRSRDAATVIQNQYRAYKEHERFKKSRDAAKIIQQRFRSHYQRSQGSEKRKSHPLTRQSSHGSEKEGSFETDRSDRTASENNSFDAEEPPGGESSKHIHKSRSCSSTSDRCDGKGQRSRSGSRSGSRSSSREPHSRTRSLSRESGSLSRERKGSAAERDQKGGEKQTQEVFRCRKANTKSTIKREPRSQSRDFQAMTRYSQSLSREPWSENRDDFSADDKQLSREARASSLDPTIMTRSQEMGPPKDPMVPRRLEESCHRKLDRKSATIISVAQPQEASVLVGNLERNVIDQATVSDFASTSSEAELADLCDQILGQPLDSQSFSDLCNDLPGLEYLDPGGLERGCLSLNDYPAPMSIGSTADPVAGVGSTEFSQGVQEPASETFEQVVGADYQSSICHDTFPGSDVGNSEAGEACNETSSLNIKTEDDGPYA